MISSSPLNTSPLLASIEGPPPRPVPIRVRHTDRRDRWTPAAGDDAGIAELPCDRPMQLATLPANANASRKDASGGPLVAFVLYERGEMPSVVDRPTLR